MKTIVFTLAFLFGITAVSFAGNHPALTYPEGVFATDSGNTQVTPWAKSVLVYPAGVVVAAAGNGVCPVMNNAITSKHEAVVTLSNGKHAFVCCGSCKDEMEKDLGKYESSMF